MRFQVATFSVLVAFCARGESLDPKILRLIPSNARLVVSVDFDRYRQSQLAGLYPITGDEGIDGIAIDSADQIHRLISVQLDAKNDQRRLYILRGAAGILQKSGAAGGNDGDGDFVLTTLEEETAIAGDAESVSQSVTRWRDAATGNSPRL